MLAAEAVTTLLRRVRDPQGSQHAPWIVLRLLTEVQRVLNTLYADVVESAVLAVEPCVMHLPLSPALPRAIRILSIETFEGSRPLAELPNWRQLATLDRRWFRRLGDRHQVWAPVGRDAFVIWPGVERITPITVSYVRLTDELQLDSLIEIDNNYHPLLLDLVEGMLLLRGRIFGPLADLIKRLEAGFGPRVTGGGKTRRRIISTGAFQPSAFTDAFQIGGVLELTGIPAAPLSDHDESDVLHLAQLLAAQQADLLTLHAYYADAMIEIARMGLFVETRLFAVEAGQVDVEPEEPTVQVHAVCYDDRDLARSALLDLEALSPQWRDRLGTPYAWTHDDETAGTVRIVPVPQVPSKGYAFIHGEPLGVDFPAYVAALFLSEARESVPRWCDLPIAFGLLQREFGRDSDHRDPEFAAACRQFGQLFLGVVLVDAADRVGVGAA